MPGADLAGCAVAGVPALRRGRLHVQDAFYEQSACSHSAADLSIAAPTARPGLYVLLPAAHRYRGRASRPGLYVLSPAASVSWIVAWLAYAGGKAVARRILAGCQTPSEAADEL